ncbi:MAG TPA: hypothetical protein DHN29_09670, partial [Cytophagales bacterium]|nr:hypothetical protein [Cytophagales bacterium]
MKQPLSKLLVKYFFVFITVWTITPSSLAQGVSFSYLIPKNGYLTAPVSPFSIRGLGVGDVIGIETGATLYNIPGLAMDDLPFDYNRPLIGPHFAALVPVDIYLKIPMNDASVKFMIGGFGWWNINPRINEGNMDRAWRAYEEWEVLNSDFEFNNKLGYGWLGGFEFQFPYSRDVSLTFEANYLRGRSKTGLRGSYSGVSDSSSTLQTKQVDLPEPSIVIEGLELSFGAIFS